MENKSKMKNGNKIWRLSGKLHREDGPAVEYKNGNKKWYQYGKLHRKDGPTIETTYGYSSWHLYGKLHREDGPAHITSNNVKYWYIHGVLHNTKGPSVLYPNGESRYYRKGILYKIIYNNDIIYYKKQNIAIMIINGIKFKSICKNCITNIVCDGMCELKKISTILYVNNTVYNDLLYILINE